MATVREQIDSYAVLGVPADRELQAIARLAAHICGVPTATVNLLDDVHQYNVATEGFEAEVLPLEDSFCATTVRLDSQVHVRDAREDPRFADHPYVTGERGSIRFYAGSQLRAEDGTNVGTLCVFDEVEHDLDAGQRAALDDLAGQAMQVLTLRAQSRQLSASNAELRRSNEDLAAFTGRIAHDLRNPIAATRGFLRLAQGAFGAELTGRARECVEHAAGATERMAVLVDDLLSFAAVGAKAQVVDVAVAAVASAVVHDLHALIAQTGGRVEQTSLATVRTDPTLLRQLLQNVVANALKYARPDLPPVVRLVGSCDTAAWSVAVIDNGRGIPAEDRDAVFDLFVRLPGGRDVSGSGIGLATCARIAGALGGEIALTDTPGGGTTVTLTVPHAG